jgi:hypothetical protein
LEDCSSTTEIQSNLIDKKPAIIDLTNDDYLQSSGHADSVELQRSQDALDKSKKEVASERSKLEHEKKMLEHEKLKFAHQQVMTRLMQLQERWIPDCEILRQRYGPNPNANPAIWAQWIVRHNKCQFERMMLCQNCVEGLIKYSLSLKH